MKYLKLFEEIDVDNDFEWEEENPVDNKYVYILFDEDSDHVVVAVLRNDDTELIKNTIYNYLLELNMLEKGTKIKIYRNRDDINAVFDNDELEFYIEKYKLL